MGFLGALKNLLSSTPERDDSEAARLKRAWGLDHAEESPAGSALASAYDKALWRRRLRRIFEELPASRDQWPELMTDARALDLDESWTSASAAEEFELLIRRAVADRDVSEQERERIDAARRLVGLSDDQAAAILTAIAAEAEGFFNAKVETRGG